MGEAAADAGKKRKAISLKWEGPEDCRCTFAEKNPKAGLHLKEKFLNLKLTLVLKLESQGRRWWMLTLVLGKSLKKLGLWL